jgi:phosphatidylglycerophosphate synthase
MVEGGSRQLSGSAARTILAAALLGLAAAGVMQAVLGLGLLSWVRTTVLLGAGAALAIWRLPAFHPFDRLGIANQVTLLRGVLVALLAGFISAHPAARLQWIALAIAVLAALLDAVDGWLARRTRMSSAYGARLDMETDALLILVLSILAWQLGKAGPWVLASGLMRYAFVAASLLLPWMQDALPPRPRRKVVAVLQTVALLIALAPFVPRGVSSPLCAVALAALVWSFVLDTALLRRGAGGGLGAASGVRRVLLLCVALALLNGMLTFHNVWPTLFVHWPGELSLDLVAVLLLLVTWRWLSGGLPRALLVVLAMLFVLGVLGRYGEVTAPALYGREVNLFWDLRHVASLAGMAAAVVPAWLLATIVLGICLVLAAFYLLAFWSLRRVALALASSRLHAGVAIAAAAMLVFFVVQRLDARAPRAPRFSTPVSQTYARQLENVAEALDGRALRELPASPALASDLSLNAGGNVLLVFLESYGRVTYDHPEFLQALGSSRAELAAAVRETGRGMVSGFVESPTFGGGSWLAHLNFLTGVEVRDTGAAELLMTQSRRTFGDELSRHGYRRVALMPGLKNSWPEGRFYGFDQIYDDAGLDYRGPAFGWWRIPDQFSLAKLDALEPALRTAASQPHQPLFMFFPTISTHTPFRPTPPYQADWSRLLGDHPFDAADLERSLPERPDWNDMGSSYVAAVAYSLHTLAGYVRTHHEQDFILIILGDHQPPAMVSGVNASWDVPVHVIASQPAILQALQRCGFVSGVDPPPGTLGRMHQLAPALLAAFDGSHAPCPLAVAASSHKH